MDKTARFKIDFAESFSQWPYKLFVRRPSLFGDKWVQINFFSTREEAHEYYQAIKDLPEYLA